jgi:hypothetical protein
MDRLELSAISIGELAQLFAATLEHNMGQLVVSDLDGIEQRLQEVGRTVFGRVVEQTVTAIAATLPSEPPHCPHCSRVMRPVAYERPRQLQGLVGDYRITRPYYVCEHCHQGYAPLDERLGLGTGAFSPGLQRVACRLGIEDSFANAADALNEALGLDVAGEAVRRVTEGIGQVAEAEAQAAMARAQVGKEPLGKEEISAESPVLLVEMDGVMVHEVDDEWHEAKVGLVAALGPKVQVDAETGCQTWAMGGPSYCTGFEDAEGFWYRLYVEACRHGLGSLLVVTVVVLGDGADWIWRRAAGFLALTGVTVIEIVDIYHAFEHLAVVANAVFGQGTVAAEGWLKEMKERLEEAGAKPVIEALRELPLEGGVVAEEARKAIGYFTEHAARMDYPRFVAMGMPIGSGVVESACKTLIQAREKGAGMRWTEGGAQAVATLRALHRSGRWKGFWQSHPQFRRPAVFPRRSAKANTTTCALHRAA